MWSVQYLSVTVELAQGLDHTLVNTILQDSLGERSTEAVSGYHSSQEVLLHGSTVLTVDWKQQISQVSQDGILYANLFCYNYKV